MRRVAPLLAVLAAAAYAPAPPPADGPRLRPAADPSAVIAAEIAFSRLAQDKGQWTAFRETAAPEAIMFVPERVRAAEWLKGRADPPVPVRWQPHSVWTSCDGSAAVTHGAWQRGDGPVGYFTTVWQRQGGGRGTDGGWRWLLDHGDALPAPLAAPEMIAARTADCSKVTDAIVPGVMDRDGALLDDVVGSSRDGSLVWNSSVRPDGGREITVWLWQGGELREVLTDTVAAPGGRAR